MTNETQAETRAISNRKLRVAVLYGGQSGEHDVSLMSSASVMEELDESKYDVTPVFIDKQGCWSVSIESLRQYDVAFPVLHGPMGEDGTVQGLLKVLGVPFVGAGVVGSAVGMDKAIFKDVMRAHGLPVARSTVILRHEWKRANPAERQVIVTQVGRELGWPVFVKPANMGSSVGISKAKTPEQLPPAIDEALQWDRKVLVEQAVPHAREFEVSVLGNDDLQASIVGEVRPRREFYDYAAKYLVKGEEESELIIPAPLAPELADRIRTTAVQVARLADVCGMTRVDFLMNGESDEGELYVNEINTIPGFTSISMYPKLWAATGLPYPKLLDRLIELALEK
jgi:D-alanine-D-alanine ligase